MLSTLVHSRFVGCVAGAHIRQVHTHGLHDEIPSSPTHFVTELAPSRANIMEENNVNSLKWSLDIETSILNEKPPTHNSSSPCHPGGCLHTRAQPVPTCSTRDRARFSPTTPCARSSNMQALSWSWNHVAVLTLEAEVGEGAEYRP